MKSQYGPNIIEILHLLFWSLLLGSAFGYVARMRFPKVLGNITLIFYSGNLFKILFLHTLFIWSNSYYLLLNWDLGISKCSAILRNHNHFKLSFLLLDYNSYEREKFWENSIPLIGVTNEGYCYGLLHLFFFWYADAKSHRTSWEQTNHLDL